MPESSGDSAMHQQLARRLRHEVGDFLQKVYATVAILQKRMPDDYVQERDILTRLRRRAEDCKHLVDAIQDFLCPLTLDYDSVDLADLAQRLVQKARAHYPDIDIEADGEPMVRASVDPDRMAQVGAMLLDNACEAGSQHVRLITGQLPDSGEVEWIVRDDGPGLEAELVGELFTPFFTTRVAHAGLGLTLVRKIVELHQGHVQAENLPGQGFQVTVRLPVGA